MLWVNGKGLFLVGIVPLGISSEAGQFAGNVLEFECDGTRVTLISEDGPILSNVVDRPAWLVHLPVFEMFESNIEPADRVIGMIQDLRQIPGFDKNELDLSNCRGTLVELRPDGIAEMMRISPYPRCLSRATGGSDGVLSAK